MLKFIHACMPLYVWYFCVARSSVVSLQVINMWKYIQSTFVLVPFIQGIQIGFYVWTLVWCIYLKTSSPCCTWKLINDNTQHPKLQQRNISMPYFGAISNNFKVSETTHSLISPKDSMVNNILWWWPANISDRHSTHANLNLYVPINHTDM